MIQKPTERKWKRVGRGGEENEVCLGDPSKLWYLARRGTREEGERGEEVVQVQGPGASEVR